MSQTKKRVTDDPKKKIGKSLTASIISNIVVEPLVLFYILPSTMNLLITQDLIFDETCRVSLAYNESVCDSIRQKKGFGYTEDQELSVQQSSTDVLFVETLIHGMIPIIILFFVGSWSDKENRRRPCILIPIIGELVAVTCLILTLVFKHQIPAMLIAIVYSLPMAISGGLPCLFLGVYSYVSTRSSEKNLTFRIGGVHTVRRIAYIIGLGISGIILNYFGFIGAYTTTFFLILSSFVYGYYIIKERKQIVAEVEEELSDVKRAPKKITGEIYIIEHFFHTVRVFLTKRPDNRRLRLYACVALLLIVNGPMKGEEAVFFLYTKFIFGWSYLHYGIFFGIQFVIEIIGSLLVLLVLVKYFKWKDEALGVLSLTSSLLACLAFAVPSMFSAGAILNIFSGTSHIALRSLMAKLVQNHEIGKTNSIFEITETFTHLIFGSLYVIMYKHTVNVYAGSFFLTSATLKFIGIFIFIWLYHQSIKHNKKKEEVRVQDETIVVS